MAATKGWRRVMEATEGSKTFNVEGEEIIAMSHHSGGTWNMHLVMPDNSEILLGAYTDNFTQAIIAPEGTRVRIADGARGAVVWVGTVDRTAIGRLL